MIEFIDDWARQISDDLDAIDNIQALLKGDDVFRIEKILLLNATICRALFDEAASLATALHSENQIISGDFTHL